MIITSLLCFFYNWKVKEHRVLMISIPSFEKEFVADFETAEMFIASNKDGSDIVFILGRKGSSRHEFASRKYQEDLERADGNTQRTNFVLANLISDSLLIGWKNVKNEDGTVIEATFENKVAILTKYPDLIMKIIKFSSNVKNFQNIKFDGDLVLDSIEKKDDAAGN